MSKLDLFFSPNYADWLLLRVFLQDYVSTYFAVQAWKRFVQKQYEMLCESVQVMRKHGYYLAPGEKECGYAKIENLLQGLVNHTNKGDSDFLGAMSLAFPLNFHELGTMSIRAYENGPSAISAAIRFQKSRYVNKELDAWQKMPQRIDARYGDYKQFVMPKTHGSYFTYVTISYEYLDDYCEFWREFMSKVSVYWRQVLVQYALDLADFLHNKNGSQ